MSGRCRSSVETQFTQQNIGKFVNINKANKDKEGDKGSAKPGISSTDHNMQSTTRPPGQHQKLFQRVHLKSACVPLQEAQKKCKSHHLRGTIKTIKWVHQH